MWNLWARCPWRAIMAGDAVCDERRLQACILAGKKDFASLNWTFRRLKSLVIGNLLKLSQQCLPSLPRLPASMQVCSLRLLHTACPHVCLFIRCRYDACQWNSHESHVWNVVISVGGIFLWNASRYVAWQTKKNWAFSVLVAAISAALHESFVRSIYAYSGSQFLLYWMRIICCIYKAEILFDNWRHFFRPSVIHVPLTCP